MTSRFGIVRSYWRRNSSQFANFERRYPHLFDLGETIGAREFPHQPDLFSRTDENMIEIREWLEAQGLKRGPDWNYAKGVLFMRPKAAFNFKMRWM